MESGAENGKAEKCELNELEQSRCYLVTHLSRQDRGKEI
jgi:hypothetical protein